MCLTQMMTEDTRKFKLSMSDNGLNLFTLTLLKGGYPCVLVSYTKLNNHFPGAHVYVQSWSLPHPENWPLLQSVLEKEIDHDSHIKVRLFVIVSLPTVQHMWT